MSAESCSPTGGIIMPADEPQRISNLPWAEMEERHRLVFETHEEGKLTFEEYLDWVVFYESDHSPALSFGTSCSRNRNLTPR
jgi:hypothetical protein